MRYYATLFDSTYLSKGLALHQSLLQHSSEDFTLRILAMDEVCRHALAQLELSNVEVIKLDYVERSLGIQDLRAKRSWLEYCWTMASQFMFFFMRAGLREITYLDADLFFFSDPTVVFDTIAERSIAITPHRFIPAKEYLRVNGEFNVGWVTFRNTTRGFACSDYWATQVRARCSAVIGCGDQAYLDEWPYLYRDDLCVLPKTVNVAPWNVGNWSITAGPCIDNLPVICYHFHEFQDNHDGTFRLTNYDLRDEDMQCIYQPYITAYLAARARIAQLRLQQSS